VFVPSVEPLNRNGKELLSSPGSKTMAIEPFCYFLVIHAFFPVHQDQLRGLAVGFVGAGIFLADLKAFQPGALGEVLGFAQSKALNFLLL
jgi:hypothetical protein